jgi:hypothetical protein
MFSRAACCALALASLPLAACSVADPRFGASQVDCGLAVASTGQTGPGNYGATQRQRTPTCELVVDNPCDVCESTHCCATRSACYGDPSCACADQALDECLDDAETSTDEHAASAACWNTFADRGIAESARVACQRAWCQTECGVP